MTALKQQIDTEPSLYDYDVSFTLPGLPLTTNRNRRLHWRKLHRQSTAWHQAVWVAILQVGKPKKTLEEAKLTFIRHSHMEPDYDGLVSSFKVVLDGLKVSSVIVDDKRKNIGVPNYQWERASVKKGYISVRVQGNYPE